MRWSLQRRIHELKAPATAAHGTTFKRDMLLLSLSDGVHTGWGEASPLSSYSGITADECDAALRPRLELLAGADPDDPDSTLRGCAEGLTGPTRAALEVALRDLAARRAGVSLLEAMGVHSARPVEIRALLTSNDLPVAQAEAEAARRAGFRAVKAKVATGGGSDHVRMGALREALGPNIHLSADANGAWEVAEALIQLELLAGTVDLVEQPVRGLAEMREVHGRCAVPLALDEDAT
ncbi:MAG: enolase C-terminal domain-like protein, partial [Actinomycetes bacterium]